MSRVADSNNTYPLIQPKDELSSETAIREFLLFLPAEIRLHVPFLTEKGLAINNKTKHLNQFQSVLKTFRRFLESSRGRGRAEKKKPITHTTLFVIGLFSLL